MESDAAREEGVLRDILEELDRERTRRAELEAKIRRLERDLEKNKESSERVISKDSFLAMEAKVSGYKDIVEALTSSRPAIAAVANSTNQQNSLPLHVVRLLETIPWDSRAKEYIFGQEDIFEWQVYDKREKIWQSQLKYFPLFFKSLPRSNAKKNREHDDERNLLLFLAGGREQRTDASRGVLTDEYISMCLDSAPELPKDGGLWSWVSGWRVNRKAIHRLTSRVFDTDNEGWSYVALPQHFLLGTPDQVFSDVGEGRTVRRRCWSRQRILVDYPHICESTKQYLGILAENARLKVASSKISEQLVQTKVALTETEEQLVDAQEQLSKKTFPQMTSADQDLNSSSNTLSFESGDTARRHIQGIVQGGNDQVKEIGSKISSWVHARNKSHSPKPGNAGDDKLADQARRKLSISETTQESDEETPDDQKLAEKAGLG